MRLGLERIAELYKTSPVFQDLVETSAATALAAGGQALLTDMTPEEIALASAVGFGAGMIGRPIVGKLGESVGKALDQRYPQSSASFKQQLIEGREMLPEALQEMVAAKSAPYQHLGGYGQMGNMLGRAYGDNAAQLAVALAAPALFGGDDV